MLRDHPKTQQIVGTEFVGEDLNVVGFSGSEKRAIQYRKYFWNIIFFENFGAFTNFAHFYITNNVDPA